jgi:hypothetical protein
MGARFHRSSKKVARQSVLVWHSDVMKQTSARVLHPDGVNEPSGFSMYNVTWLNSEIFKDGHEKGLLPSRYKRAAS